MTIWLDAFRYHDLFRNLFRREFRVKYKGSALGIVWSLIFPLALVGVYTLVFSTLLRTTSVDHFPLFVVTGLLTWVFFQTSMQSACTAFVGQAGLLKQVRFPRQLLPLSVVAANLVTFVVMFAIVLPINLAIVPDTRGTFWAALPLALVLVAFTSGLSVIVACANALYRDVEHLVATILLPWFFLTPVFYIFDDIPAVQDHPTLIEVVKYANPMTPILTAIRDPLFFGKSPSWIDVVYSVAAAIVSLAVATIVFRRVDDRLAAEL